MSPQRLVAGNQMGFSRSLTLLLQITLPTAEETLYNALIPLQIIHDAACKTNVEKIMIERPTFRKIAFSVHRVWAQVKIE
jgi:hypothetical protein